MLNRASLSSPSPLHRDRSWMEYFEEKMARVMRSIRGSATLPDSSALRGRKPQQTVANTIASNRGTKSSSNGQLMKTEVAGSVFRFPWPKCSRVRWATAPHRATLLGLQALRRLFDIAEPLPPLGRVFSLDRDELAPFRELIVHDVHQLLDRSPPVLFRSLHSERLPAGKKAWEFGIPQKDGDQALLRIFPLGF